MNEAEWLCCSDLDLMLRHASGSLSPRKAILASCAFCRRLWPLLEGEWQAGQRAIEFVERSVDGQATEAEAIVAQFAFRDAHNRSHRRLGVRDPLEPIRYLFDPGGSPAYAARAARRVFPKKARDKEFPAQIAIFRDLIGNPFRPIRPVTTSLTPTVVRGARAIYEASLFGDMAVLADALEEGGCADADILAHCRGPGPHFRGCWVVDLLLGKS